MAPSPSALRLMLLFCESFATSHGLLFHPTKAQIIQFFNHSHLKTDPHIFCGHRLSVASQIVHLGHILTYNLSDDKDIQSKCRDIVCKTNSLFCSFPNISHGIGLYGSSLWSLFQCSVCPRNQVLRVYGNFPIIPYKSSLHCQAAKLNIPFFLFQLSSNLLRLVPVIWSNIYSTDLLIVIPRLQFEIW